MRSLFGRLAASARSWLQRLQITERCGSHQLVYRLFPPAFIREYHRYLLSLFRQVLPEQTRRLELEFGPPSGKQPGHRRIDIQFEHTLVKPGGRDSENALPGAITDAEGGHYLVRVDRLEYLQQLDLVIEYSRANIRNLQVCGRFTELLARTIQISPLLYPPPFDQHFSRAGRKHPLITLIADTSQPRRREFLRQAEGSGLPLRNWRGIFDKHALARLYRNSRVLVNVHQTDHHHTLEELRLLPALQCGIVIVSEDVPLKESIPYSRFIIWSSYAGLVETTRTVLENYQQYFERIFHDPQLPQVLRQLQQDNLEAVRHAVRDVL